MQTHFIANFLSVELDELARALAILMTQQSDARFEFVRAGSLDDLAAGRIEVAFLCGLPFTALVDTRGPVLEPIAAARVDDARVGERPEYYADLVVAAEAPYQALGDLRGRVFGYNEIGSFSGHAAMRYELLNRSLATHFSGRTRTGSHKQSIESLLNRRVDAATIDSQVLLVEQLHRPQLAEELRVIDSFGPYPMPPIVVSRKLDANLIARLRRLLLALPDGAPQLRKLLTGLCVSGFRAVNDAYYDPIREVSRALQTSPEMQ